MFYDIQDSADEFVTFINENGGFAVVGWYKHGKINDTSSNDNENVVDSENVWFHIVSLYPTNKEVLKMPQLIEKQYDQSSDE